jgi:hypothetical protein
MPAWCVVYFPTRSAPGPPLPVLGSLVNDNTLLRLARAIDADQAFDLLPILADALEDAGFTNAEHPHYLQSSDSHIRSCWAVDLVLEKS